MSASGQNPAQPAQGQPPQQTNNAPKDSQQHQHGHPNNQQLVTSITNPRPNPAQPPQLGFYSMQPNMGFVSLGVHPSQEQPPQQPPTQFHYQQSPQQNPSPHHHQMPQIRRSQEPKTTHQHGRAEGPEMAHLVNGGMIHRPVNPGHHSPAQHADINFPNAHFSPQGFHKNQNPIPPVPHTTWGNWGNRIVTHGAHTNHGHTNFSLHHPSHSQDHIPHPQPKIPEQAFPRSNFQHSPHQSTPSIPVGQNQPSPPPRAPSPDSAHESASTASHTASANHSHSPNFRIGHQHNHHFVPHQVHPHANFAINPHPVDGGFSDVEAPDAECLALVKKHRAEIENSLGKKFSKFEAVQMKVQSVEGVNFDVKIDAGEECIHVRIHVPQDGSPSRILLCKGLQIHSSPLSFR